MKTPKTIKLFMLDGISDGRISCELSNWTGKAIKIPRVLLKESEERPELKGTGVYFLFGRDEEKSNLIYIGEAEDIYQRLIQHLSKKDFWNEAIIFTSKDDNLNKAHIKYLEHRLHQIATKTKRYIIQNANIPNKPAISEADKAEMEEFIKNILMIVPVLGHKVFDERIVNKVIRNDNFYLSGPRGAQAEGLITSEGFVIFKGSHFAFEVVPSFQQSYLKLREDLITNHKLLQKEGSYELLDDYIFTSPSSAATLVLGRSANGLTEWKNKKGLTLREVEFRG